MNLVDEFKKHLDEHVVDIRYYNNEITSEDLDEIKRLLETNINIGYVIFSNHLLKRIKKDTNLNEKLDNIKTQLIKNIHSFDNHPNDYIHFLLVKYTYNYNDEAKQASNEIILEKLKIDGWKVLEIEYDANKKESKNENEAENFKDIYFSLIFKNEKLKQLVLAFQGFKLNFINLFSNNALTEMKDKIQRNYERIENYIMQDLNLAINECKQNHLNLSFTSYSFGNWIALKCLHKTLRYKLGSSRTTYKLKAKVVLFECTGSLIFWKILNETSKINNLSDNLIDLYSCDIIVYLTEPNLFNICDTHIGNRFVIKNDFKNNLIFLGRLNDLNANHTKIRECFNSYKKKLEENFFSYQLVYYDILKSDKNTLEQFKEEFKENFNKKQNELNEVYASGGFFINSIEALTDEKLNTIENHFDPSTQELDYIRHIRKWPKHYNSFNSSEEVNYYHKIIDIIQEQINNVMIDNTNNATMLESYEDEPISHFHCYFRTHMINTSMADFYLYKLGYCSEHEINSTFLFIKKQLVYLKRLIKIEKIKNFEKLEESKELQNFPVIRTYKISSKSSKHKIENIKSALHRLAYIDKQMQLKLGILDREENYQLFTKATIASIEDEVIFDIIYDCDIISKNKQTKPTNILFFKILNFAIQNLENIMKELNDVTKFEDNEFEAFDGSLFNDPKNRNNFQYYNEGKENEMKVEIKWLRPSEINFLLMNTSNYAKDGISRAIYRNISAYHVTQGDLNDCWLVDSMIVLCNRKYILDHIFMATNSITQSKCINHGCYALTLCINGIWEAIIIDDRLPSRPDGRPKYIQTYGYELWGCLIEKALAKCNKTYENLANGTFQEGFSIMSGYASQTFIISSANDDQLKLWANILISSQRNSLIGCGCLLKTGMKVENYEKNGLELNHGYALIKAIELDSPSIKLILLRNPYGYLSWTGDWSGHEKSNPCWTNDLRIKLRKEYPDLPIDELHAFGTFWIEFQDFCKYFGEVTICDISEQKYEERINGVSILNDDASINIYELDILYDGSIIYLELFNHQSIRYSQSSADLSLALLDSDDNIVTGLFHGYVLNVSQRLELNKGKYKILPISFRYWKNPSHQNKFNLIIHCSNTFIVKKKTESIDYLSQAILDFFFNSPDSFNIISDDSNDYVYNFSLGSYSFVIANNNTNKYLIVETKIEPGEIVSHNDFEPRSSEVNNNFTTVRFTNAIEDLILPNTKKILLILSNYGVLRTDINAKNPKVKVISEFVL